VLVVVVPPFDRDYPALVTFKGRFTMRHGNLGFAGPLREIRGIEGAWAIMQLVGLTPARSTISSIQL
jgi:hypothetical protein